MAIVRLQKSILETSFDTINVSTPETIEKIIRDNTDEEDIYSSVMCECYDCDTGKTFFAPIESDNEKTSVIIIVNGKSEKNINYEIKENDDISIIVTPASGSTNWLQSGQTGDGNWNWWGALLGNITGSITGGLSGMSIGTSICPGYGSLIGLAIGASIGGTIGFFVGGFGTAAVLNSLSKKSDQNYESGSSLPDIQGAKNSGLLGNPFPMVIGKHLITPFIAASPVSKYTGNAGNAEYVRIVYCAGYAPLKLSEFKFDSLPVAHNLPWSGNNSLHTVIHGMITGVDTTSDGTSDKGEILRKWSNNDIKLEILQQNPNSDTVDYGTIYTKTEIQKAANSTPLFIADNSLTDLTKTISYHGKAFNQLRTNSIRFSEQDPMEITVDLDFQKGLYSTHTDSNGNTVYEYPPCWIAIQWRVFNKNAPDTGGDDSGESLGEYAWHSFDTINGIINKEQYTSDKILADMQAHKGNSLTSVGTIVNKASDNEILNDIASSYYDYHSGYNSTSGSNKLYFIKKENGGNCLDLIITKPVSSNSGNTVSRSNLAYTFGKYAFSSEVKKIVLDKDYYVFDDDTRAFSSPSTYLIRSGTTVTIYNWAKYNSYELNTSVNSGWIDAYAFNIQNLSGKISMIDEFRCTTSVSLKDYIDNNYNGNYSDFLLSPSNTTKSIQVRVVRLSPCYINQTNASGYSYNDAFTWSYIKTVPFDEDKLIDSSNWSVNIPEISKGNYIWNYIKISYSINDSYTSSVTNAKSIYGYDDTKGKIVSVTQYYTSKDNTVQSVDITDSTWSTSIPSVGLLYNLWEYKKITYNDGSSTNTTPSSIYCNNYNQCLTGIDNYYMLSSSSSLINSQHSGILTYKKPFDESDMKKFCFIALQVKADVVENITSQISKLTCIAESFSPTFDTVNKKWIPENVSSIEKYYSPIDSSGKRKEITKSEFEEYRQNGKSAIRSNAGNDFITQIGLDIFKDSNKNVLTSDSVSYTRYILDSETGKKYICSNPASGVALACVGGHLGIDAFGYDKINMVALGELFEDCLDMTDGSTYSKATEENIESYNYYVCNPTDTADGTTTYYTSMSDTKGTVLVKGTSLSGYYEINLSTTVIRHNVGDLVHMYFKCNAYVYQAMKLEDMITTILTAGRAAFSIDSLQRLFVIQDKKVDYPIGIINQQNCISSSNSISFEEPPSGLQIGFNDENDGYDTNYIYCMNDGESSSNPKKQIEQYTIKWVTNPVQIWSLGRWALAVRVLSKEILTRKIGWTGYSIGFGSVVKVADDTLLIGENNGGRITELIEDSEYIYGFILSECYEYKGTVDKNGLCTQGVDVFQPSQYQESKCVTIRMSTVEGIDYNGTRIFPVVGKTNKVIFYKKLSKTERVTEDSVSYAYKPEIDNIVAIGEMGLITALYRVKTITPENKGKFTYTLIPYNDKFYNYGKALPSFQNNISIPDRSEGDSYNLDDSSVSTDQIQQQVADNTIVNKGDLASAPSDAKRGWIYHNTQDGNTYYYDGTSWIIWAQKGDTGDSAIRYNLSVSSPVILISSSGGISPSVITATSTQQTGNTGTPNAYSGRFIIYTKSLTADNYTQVYKSTTDESSYSYNIPSSDIKSIKFELYGAGDSGKIIESEEIQAVSASDGYTVAAENNSITFSSMYSGFVYEQTQKSVFHVYKGLEEIQFFRIESVSENKGIKTYISDHNLYVVAEQGTDLEDSGSISVKIRIKTGNGYILGDEGYTLGDEGYDLGDVDDSTSDAEIIYSLSFVKIATSKYFIAHYSSDGKSWHEKYVSTDIFMQTSTDSGISWSDTISISKSDVITYSLYCDFGKNIDIVRNREGKITPSEITVSAFRNNSIFTGDIDVLYSTDDKTYTSIVKRNDIISSTVTIPDNTTSFKAILYASGGNDVLSTSTWNIPLGGMSETYLGIGTLSSLTSPDFIGTTVKTTIVGTTYSYTISDESYYVSAITGDWMINYTGNIATGIYYFNGSNWIVTTDSKYASDGVVSDIMKLKKAGYNLDNWSAYINLIVENLFVTDELVDKIAAKTITLLPGGSIKGSGTDGSLEITSSGKVTGKKCSFEDAIITGDFSSKNISITGFKAGDIALRKLGSINASNGGTSKIYSQICGTGSVRVSYSVSTGEYMGGRLTMGHGSTVVIIKTYNENISVDESYDIDIQEGDNVYIQITAESGGLVAGNITVSNITISTDGANGILSYLGMISSTTSPGGASR